MDKVTKDHVGGALLLVLGIAVAVAGIGYGAGTLRQMGSGFMPVVFGVLLAAIGVALLFGAARASGGAAAAPPAEMAHLAGPVVQWRGWICIVAGVLSFALLGQHGGLVPASFVSVFVAALGDRGNSVRAAATLAAVLTALGVVVFHYALPLYLPLLSW